MVKHQRSCQMLGAAAVLAWASYSLANGRFPRAERVIENPDDPNQLYIAGTYGILATNDRGQSWYHICEASFALQDNWLGDPILDLTADGSLLVGVETSLNVSRDRGCQWAPVLGGDAAYVFDDSIARSDPSTVVALLGKYADGGIAYSLRESRDKGATWGPPSAALPADNVFTIDIDPRDAAHLYATGLANGVGQLLTSSDRGATWTLHAIPRTNANEPPYLAGLHPLDSNRIFVRTDSWVPIDGALTANDAVFYSGDGGETWTELFRGRAKMFGFALSPDGSTVLIGYGDPLEGAGQVVSGPFGVFKSATAAFSFEQIFAGPVGCLAWTKTGVYVCGSQSFDGFELAFSPSPDFTLDGAAPAPLLLLDRIEGPLACGAGTSGAACAPAWDVACATFGACRDAGGSGGAEGSDAGSAGQGGNGSGSTAGCGCRISRKPLIRSESLLGLLGLLSLVWRASARGIRP